MTFYGATETGVCESCHRRVRLRKTRRVSIHRTSGRYCLGMGPIPETIQPISQAPPEPDTDTVAFGMTRDVPGMVRTPVVTERTGVTERQLRYWIQRGITSPAEPDGSGPGRFMFWSEEEITKVTAFARMLNDGIAFEKAAALVKAGKTAHLVIQPLAKSRARHPSSGGPR